MPFLGEVKVASKGTRRAPFRGGGEVTAGRMDDLTINRAESILPAGTPASWQPCYLWDPTRIPGISPIYLYPFITSVMLKKGVLSSFVRTKQVGRINNIH